MAGRGLSVFWEKKEENDEGEKSILRVRIDLAKPDFPDR